MGLFDGVGGVGFGGIQPLSVATTLGAAASAAGVPGFSMVPAPFYLMAGMGWSSRSSYFGHPEFRGVADMAIGSNDMQRGWLPSFMGGLGVFGIGAPPVGSGGYNIGPYPSFDPMAMLGWMYQQTFGPSQQPAGPAQPAAPQPAQVNANEGEKKGDESGGAAQAGRPNRRRGGRAARPAPLTPTETARLQALDAKKRNPIPFIGGLNAAEQAEYDGLSRRAVGHPTPSSPSAGGTERQLTSEENERFLKILGKPDRTPEEKEELEKIMREHPSVFK